MKLSKADLDELRRAKEILENPGLAAKLSSLAGAPLEKGMRLLPARLQKGVHEATQAALMKALALAVRSLGGKARLRQVSSPRIEARIEQRVSRVKEYGAKA